MKEQSEDSKGTIPNRVIDQWKRKMDVAYNLHFCQETHMKYDPVSMFALSALALKDLSDKELEENGSSAFKEIKKHIAKLGNVLE